MDGSRIKDTLTEVPPIVVSNEVSDEDAAAIDKLREAKTLRENLLGLSSDWAWDYFPDLADLPENWRPIDQCEGGFRAVVLNKKGLPHLAVIASCGVEQDGNKWMHLSVSRRKHLPTWGELVMVRDAIIGTDYFAYQVIPPRSEHVDIADVLHMWILLDDDKGQVFPDFTEGTGLI